ncbi:MAG: hypothetical protein ABJB97_09330 [Acidobacteriota bacterium]
MKFPVLIVVVLTAVFTSHAQRPGSGSTNLQSGNDKSRYIGLRHGDDYPPGHKWVGGALLSDPYKDKRQYGVDEVAKGTARMLWLELLTHNDSAGKAHWEIKDVLFLPFIRKNQTLFYVDCLLNNKSDPELIAIVDNVVRKGYFAQVRYAWRANQQTEKFQPLPLKGIKCVSQGDD